MHLSIVGIYMVLLPISLLEKSLDKQVSLVLKDGRLLTGKLAGFDEFMNLVMDDTEEELADKTRKRIGTVIIRGNNIVSISAL
jgi:small nuclear ribonucleoprotein (snRNP)-like protein